MTTGEPSPQSAPPAARNDNTARIAQELASLTGSTTDPFAAAVRTTRMPMIITNPRLPDNPIIFANDSFCRLTGYSRDEIIGRNCRFLQGAETSPAVTAKLRAAVAAAEALEIDIRNYRKNGEPFWNRLLMAPVRDSDGVLTYFFASQVDVTLERDRLAGLKSDNAALVSEVAGRLRAQEESEQRLRFATDAGRMGIWYLDLQTQDFSCSDLFLENFGLSRNDRMTVDALRSMIHPGDRARRDATLAHAIETGADYDIEYRIVRPGGDVAWLYVRAQIERALDGRPIRLAGISTDVTARRKAEDDLRRTNDLLNTIMETTPGLIFAKDRDGRMLVANEATLAVIGKPWSAVQGRTDREFLADPVQAEIVMANDRAVYEQGATLVVEERVTRTADENRIFLSTKTPLRNQTGAVVGLVGVSQDITDRKQAEADLQLLNATLEARVAERTRERDRTWNKSQDLLLVLESTGVCTAVNPAWTSILGWQPADVLGVGLARLVHPEDAEPARKAFAHATMDVLPRFECRLQHRDGSWLWFNWAASPDAGMIYASGRNITAEKEQAEALARAEEALRQSQEMEAVGQLTGGIAHDFNNLLTGITGSLELVQRRTAAGRLEGLERYTSAAITSAQRAAALTQRLLAFARRQPLDPRRVEANRLIAGMEDLLRRTLGPTIDLEMVLAGGLWPTICDPNQLESALLNLAINARDAMPDGGRLTIETVNAFLDEAYARAQGGEVKPGQYVAVCVTDTGIGMTPDIAERAFEPFFTTKPTGQGTGLGLSMLYGFVRQSGGHVRIYSEVGRGSTFRIYLPRDRSSVPAASADGAAAPRDMQPGDGETVLVVDDEAAVRMLVVETLQDLGYAALEASDGAAGLRILQSGVPIDLLVTDVGMPGLNGRQLADAARAIHPQLRVLFMTGYAHNAAIGDGSLLDHGMEIVTKPFALDALATKIRDMIEGK